MKDISYIFRTYWVIVPEVVYIILLFGSLLVGMASIGMVIRCIVRKAKKNHFTNWLIVLLIASTVMVLTMTGKIVPHTAFGGSDSKSMNDIIENEPSVTGIVEEVYSDYIIMYSENAEGYPNGSHWSISLNVENKDSYTDVAVGDEIVVYYDGMAMETDPLQVRTVYAITLKTSADRTVNEVQ